MKKKLYVLRHCQTSFNKENIVSGQTDCPLIDDSIDYSILNKEDYLKSYILISSPLNRCVLTGKILQSQSKLQISAFIDPRIIERNMGILEGKKRCNLVKEYPDYFLNGHFRDYMTPPMGESYDDFKFRIISFVSYMKKLLSKHNIIICSHNQTLRMLTAIINGKSYENIPKYSNGIVKEIFCDYL